MKGYVHGRYDNIKVHCLDKDEGTITLQKQDLSIFQSINRHQFHG